MLKPGYISRHHCLRCLSNLLYLGEFFGFSKDSGLGDQSLHVYVCTGRDHIHGDCPIVLGSTRINPTESEYYLLNEMLSYEELCGILEKLTATKTFQEPRTISLEDMDIPPLTVIMAIDLAENLWPEMDVEFDIDARKFTRGRKVMGILDPACDIIIFQKNVFIGSVQAIKKLIALSKMVHKIVPFEECDGIEGISPLLPLPERSILDQD